MVVDDRVKNSMELYDRAGEIIPGWTQLVSRRASQFASGVSPVYAQGAKGSRFVDVDGNEYIDWVNCVSAVILGHADDTVDGAVKAADRQGQPVHGQQPPGDRARRAPHRHDPQCRDGPLLQGRRRGMRCGGEDSARDHGQGQDTLLRLPRLARLVPVGELPGGPGDGRVSRSQGSSPSGFLRSWPVRPCPSPTATSTTSKSCSRRTGARWRR